jgi:hypothetical protein
MAVTTPLFWMKLIWVSKIVGGSLSKPTMNPPCTSRPDFWIFLTLVSRSRFLFWNLLHSARLCSWGVSMPTKTTSKPELRAV